MGEIRTPHDGSARCDCSACIRKDPSRAQQLSTPVQQEVQTRSEPTDDEERMRQLWRRAALDLGEARAVLEWWRDEPDAFPGGAAEVVEKLFEVLGVKGSRRG
jgi:hypothetical protein